MRIHSTVGSLVVASAVLIAGVGCGGTDVLPVGGPFGGTLDPAAVVDGGIYGDASGVLDPGVSANGASAAVGIPTWTDLYTTYFAAGTIGNCTQCHAADMATPALSYSWLNSPSLMYLDPTDPLLLDTTQSCLSWFGGNMPPAGPTANATAIKDFTVWAKAGAKNN